MSDNKIFNVLFLCTHNSARSIMAEVLLNYLGKDRFKAYSGGSSPGTMPNPFALQTLTKLDLPIEGLRSKDWNEFAKPGAPLMDFVFTVCDTAAGEVCPLWPGQPITSHWGVEDPSLFEGTNEDKLREFARVANILKRRIEFLTNLPIAQLDRLMLEKQLREIAKQ